MTKKAKNKSNKATKSNKSAKTDKNNKTKDNTSKDMYKGKSTNRSAPTEFPEIPDIVKDVVYAVAIVTVILGVGYALTGTWPFMVAVESGSMVPHLNIGDVVILVSPSKKHIVTLVEGKKEHYKSFGDYGDVIVYYPNGNRHTTPVIHRVIAWVKKGQPIVGINRTTGKLGELRYYHGMLIITNKSVGKVTLASSSGYITQGDHNPIPDEPIITQPVKPSWILGVAVYKIPYIGYPRLILQKII